MEGLHSRPLSLPYDAFENSEPSYRTKVLGIASRALTKVLLEQTNAYYFVLHAERNLA